MKRFKQLLAVLIILLTFYVSAQQAFEDNLIDWIPSNQSDYTGVYELGQQERQAFLRVISTPNYKIFQLKTNFQYIVGGPRDVRFHTYSNTTIDEHGNVSFEEHKGQFVKYCDFFGDTIYSIRFKPALTDMSPLYELGKRKKLESSYKGKFIQASTAELKANDLTGLTPKQLQIMRNEIFARYGYIFKEGGEMSRYFKNQYWYKPERTEVNELFTELEKSNIQLIQKEEASR
ncbi:YARHG domain-containing protein [Reichenbachiella sp.]